MKIVLAALLLFCGSLFAAGNAEKDVLAAMDSWKAASIKGDGAALSKLYHDDLLYTHSNGMTQTKAASITALTSPTGPYKGVDLHDVIVQIHGDTAIVEYKMDLTHFAGDVAHLHEIMVWLKSANGWQMLARHATRLPVAAPKP